MDYLETANLRVNTLTGIVSLRIAVEDDVEWKEIGRIDAFRSILDNLPRKYLAEYEELFMNWTDSQDATHRAEALSRDLEPGRWR